MSQNMRDRSAIVVVRYELSSANVSTVTGHASRYMLDIATYYSENKIKCVDIFVTFACTILASRAELHIRDDRFVLLLFLRIESIPNFHDVAE